MKNILLDIVAHTHTLDGVNALKISASEQDTVIESLADDQSVVLNAKTHQPIASFQGVFGVPDLSKLAYLLKIPEYREDAKIEVKSEQHDGEMTPAYMRFENKTGDFSNVYRFMSRAAIETKIRSAKPKIKNWDVEFTPSITATQRLKLMAGAHNDETVFQVKTENGNLNFYFGDASAHAGNFTFQNNVDGKLSHTWNWPIKTTSTILELDGDKTISISNEGAIKITVDSGIAEYTYILPAQVK